MVFQGNGTNLLPPFVANLQFGQPLAICQWSLWHSLVKAEKFVYIYVSSCLFTDLGNLIGDTQCGTFRIFQPLRFYVKSILVTLKPRKLPFRVFTIWTALNFKFLNIFDVFKCVIPKKLKFKASKIVSHYLSLSEISQNWFHVKSDYIDKIPN